MESRSEHNAEVERESRMATRAGRIWNIASIGTVFGVVVSILGGVMALTLRYGDLKTQDTVLAQSLASVTNRLDAIDQRAATTQAAANQLRLDFNRVDQALLNLDSKGTNRLQGVSDELIRLKESYTTELRHITESLARIESSLEAHKRQSERGGSSISPQSDGPLIGRDQDHFEGTAVY
jgi:uncharacterized membrane-anchored protein YhcB (DUF1043 family)